MEFNIDKNELQKALNVVGKGMSSRATLPILAGVLVSAQDDMVTFQTTDLETSISHTAHADVIEPGRAVVPGKLFADIVKSLQDAAVHVKTNDAQVEVGCLNSSFTLSTLAADDFPAFPQLTPQQLISVPAGDLARSVQRVAFAASKDEARAVLMGILVEVDEKNIRLVTTDGYRLAVSDMPVVIPQSEPFSAIIPSHAFDDVMHLAAGEQAISIGFTDNQIAFSFGDTVFISRRTEGNYPDYKGLLPKKHDVSATMDVAELKTAVKRVSLLAQSHAPVRFHFDLVAQNGVVSANTQDVGGAQETIQAEVAGETDVDIAFNHQYVLDGLNVLEGATCLEMQDCKKPGIFKQKDDESYLYLVMPMHVR